LFAGYRMTAFTNAEERDTGPAEERDTGLLLLRAVHVRWAEEGPPC
jgi:DNA-binding NtrC family response regulator